MSDDVVKKEPCPSIILIVERRHGLKPFGEIINGHNDVFMAARQGMITGHEFNHPFT